MFTVKATYRNETRKFTFPEGVLFPTYEELAQQLCRVFPMSHTYYLSKLVFSPDASKPGRILIGKEVHSAEEYSQRVAPLHRYWPNPRLKFTILERTPPKVPLVDQQSVGQNSGPPKCQILSSHPNACKPPAPNPRSLIPPPPSPISKLTFPPTGILPPPPPPILFPPSLSFPSTERMGVKETSSGPLPPSPASLPLNQHSCAPCCSIAKGKADIEALLAAFQEDFNRIIRSTFGPDHELTSSTNPDTFSPAVDADAPCVPPGNEIHQPRNNGASVTSLLCFVCRTNFSGIWYGCVKCPWHAVCPACFSKSRTAHTLSFGPSHVVEQRSSLVSLPLSDLRPRELPMVTNSPQADDRAAKTTDVPVHRGVVCNNCDRTITGIRHKCLDCPDYDLCTSCIQAGAVATHNPFHEFFDIETPGRVYVHTVFSGGYTRPRTNGHSAVQTRAELPNAGVSFGEQPVRHSATCNLCDSAIVGERFKCISCPDFDTCSTCFVITPEQHPNHGFVKLNRVEDLMVRSSLPQCQVAHLAACNSCGQTIRGARYKCMHSSCADFDLCSSCEALPIPVHPLTHPMLKLKTVDTVIPTVYRVGQMGLIDRPSSVDCRESGDCVKSGPPIHPNLPLISRPACTQTQASNSSPASCVAKPLGESDGLCKPVKGAEGESSDGDDASKSSVGILGTPLALSPTLDIFRQLWPKVNEEVKVTQVQDITDQPVDSVEVEGLEAEDSSITSRSLIATPVTLPGPRISGRDSSPSILANQSLATVLDDHRTPSPVFSGVVEPHLASLLLINEQLAMESFSTSDKEAPKGSLSAAFVTDATISDGQVFPPGAEFIKAWHMVNDGDRPWPPTTELRFVAGEKFMSDSRGELKAKIGYVDQGEKLDVWTGELKAPDVPGRYVGYWQLNDGLGTFFGSRIWIDLTVADQQSSDEENDNLLAASSMVMPSPNPTAISGRMNDGAMEGEPGSPYSSKPVSDISEDSDGSSVSLIPSWDDDDDEWRDATRTEPLEYVVVYDSNSENE